MILFEHQRQNSISTHNRIAYNVDKKLVYALLDLRHNLNIMTLKKQQKDRVNTI